MNKNKKYVFDLEKIIEFANKQSKAGATEKEILDTYDLTDDGDRVVTKTIRELTAQGDSQGDNIRYDLIKTFVIQILTTDFEHAYGTEIAIDTLVNAGIMIEK